jgi:DnaJ-class molecular chaperone
MNARKPIPTKECPTCTGNRIVLDAERVVTICPDCEGKGIIPDPSALASE